MQVYLLHHTYSIFNFLFHSENVGEKGGILQKFEYLNQKSILEEITSIFHIFKRLFEWKK